MLRACLTLIASTVMLGCQPAPRPAGGQLPAPSKAPPAVPSVQVMPVSSELKASAMNELQTALGSPDRFVRAHAIETAAGSVGPPAFRDIIRGLTDPAPVARFASAMACGDLKLKAAREPLLRLLNDPDTDVRVAVRYALHRLGDTRFSRFLEKSAVDTDAHIRANTVVVLGKLGEASALKILREMTNDPQAQVRLQVAEAMWRLGERSGLEDLVAGTLSAYPDDQMLCIMALATGNDPSIIQHVRTKLVSDYIQIRLTAARAMGVLGSDEGYTIAMTATRAPDPRLRAMAALALGAIRRADSQDALSPLLKDPTPDVRLAAAGAILRLR